jgi:hypothetical protein
VTTYHPAYHSLMSKAANSRTLPITDPESVHQREIARMAGLKEPLLDRGQNCVRFEKATARTRNGNRVAVHNLGGNLFRSCLTAPLPFPFANANSHRHPFLKGTP